MAEGSIVTTFQTEYEPTFTSDSVKLECNPATDAYLHGQAFSSNETNNKEETNVSIKIEEDLNDHKPTLWELVGHHSRTSTQPSISTACGDEFLAKEIKVENEVTNRLESTPEVDEKYSLLTLLGSNSDGDYYLTFPDHSTGISQEKLLIEGNDVFIVGQSPVLDVDSTKESLAELVKNYNSLQSTPRDCSTKIKQEDSLKDLKALYSDKKQFTCSQCSCKFCLPSYVRKNLTVRKGKEPDICKNCEGKTKRNSYLQNHLKTLMSVNIESFRCSVCEMKFSTKSILFSHYRRHQKKP